MSRLGLLLQAASARRLVQRAGDAAASLCAVVGTLWSWRAIDGYPLTYGVRSVSRRMVRALGCVWLLLLRPPFTSRPSFPPRDAAVVFGRAVVDDAVGQALARDREGRLEGLFGPALLSCRTALHVEMPASAATCRQHGPRGPVRRRPVAAHVDAARPAAATRAEGGDASRLACTAERGVCCRRRIRGDPVSAPAPATT